MPYMDQWRKKELAPLIKSICKKHGITATLSVTSNGSTLNLNIKSGSIDFDGMDQKGTCSINPYHYKKDFADNEKALAFSCEVVPAMNIGNYDNSNHMNDYVDVGWYTLINIGNYGKPYILKNIN